GQSPPAPAGDRGSAAPPLAPSDRRAQNALPCPNGRTNAVWFACARNKPPLPLAIHRQLSTNHVQPTSRRFTTQIVGSGGGERRRNMPLARKEKGTLMADEYGEPRSKRADPPMQRRAVILGFDELMLLRSIHAKL